LVVLSYTGKNYALFGSLGSGQPTLGFNLYDMITEPFPAEEKEQLIREGVISSLARYHPEGENGYVSYAAHVTPPPPTGVAAADALFKPTSDWSNWNNPVFEKVGAAYTKDALNLFKRRPAIYFTSIGRSFALYFQPAGDYGFCPFAGDDRRANARRLERLLNASRLQSTGFNTLFLPACLLFAAVVSGRWLTRRFRSPAGADRSADAIGFTVSFCLFTVLCHLAVISCFASSRGHDQCRYRMNVMPYYYLFAGMLMARSAPLLFRGPSREGTVSLTVGAKVVRPTWLGLAMGAVAVALCFDALMGWARFEPTYGNRPVSSWIAHPEGEEASKVFADLLRHHPKADVRWRSAMVLASLGSGAAGAVPQLVRAVKKDSPWVARAAAFALGQMGSEAAEAVPTLVAALASTDPLLRQSAAVALGRIGLKSKAGVAALGESLRDPDPAVRLAAANSLAAVCPDKPEGVSVLIELLEDSTCRDRAVSVLGALGTRAAAATPALREFLQAGDPALCGRATDALRQIAPHEMLEYRGRDSGPFEGGVDVANVWVVSGWLRNRQRLDVACSVDIYDGASLIGTVSADRFRQDLLEAGIGDGRHAFLFLVPEGLRDGLTHEVHVRIAGTDVPLRGSPREVGAH
jgi:hypothetical protein